MGLIIEIDGASHDHKTEYDTAREKYFINLELRVYRILDWDVKRHIQTVLMGLEDYIIREFGIR